MDKVIDYKNEDSTAHISVTIEQADVNNRYEKLLKEYLKDAQMPGFRKGHVPRSVFEKKYEEALSGETANKLIEESLEESLTGLEREVVRFSQPQVIAADTLNKDQKFSFTLKVEVMPQVEIKGIESVSAPLYEITVSEADIEAELQRLQEQNAFIVNRNDVVVSGNILDINYVELDENGKEIDGSARQNFVFTIGNDQNLYDLDDDVLGMKAGESKVITKTFAEDYKHAELAGRKVSLKITINSVKERNLPELDDEFAQDINAKYQTINDLKQDIKEKFVENSLEIARGRRCDEILQELAKSNTFPIPEGLILADVEQRFSQLARQMNISEEQLVNMIGGSAAGLIEQWRPESEVSVRHRLILSSIMQAENISVGEDEFSQSAEKTAKKYNSSVDDLTKQVGEGNFKAYIEEQVKTEKTLALLSDKAGKGTAIQLTLEEFHNLDKQEK
ncbi:trigger factor [Entomospira entomophila]|uniref:Trigger factor n=1 Tax=Entomospira entomophila TaxID=2719988 RepID=A0A968GEJ1_9SPIO|nr:trigger factor [Entomospira entomophilus]NIZ40999.1 trigger factor [Entomospira entomophilus]WDI35212.1 trigger factor [Entomospira entomophilus]